MRVSRRQGSYEFLRNPILAWAQPESRQSGLGSAIFYSVQIWDFLQLSQCVFDRRIECGYSQRAREHEFLRNPIFSLSSTWVSSVGSRVQPFCIVTNLRMSELSQCVFDRRRIRAISVGNARSHEFSDGIRILSLSTQPESRQSGRQTVKNQTVPAIR